MATSFNVNRADLDYILIQIRIAEAHASGVPLAQAISDAYGVSLNDASLLPAGLRTVDGQDNNLLAGQAEFGAADNPFPRLTDPVFRNDADGDTMPLGPPGGPVVDNTNYGAVGTPTAGNGGHSGNVADADPRIISNLIVDMSVNNPAAIAAWFANPLSVEAWHERNPGKNPVAPGAAVGPNDVVLTNADLAEIPNQSPDVGLSPGFNAFMTFFGQFFDHGLDLVTKGNNGTVFIPLQPDDPLYVPGGNANFMVLTRAAPTLDANGVPQHTNTTTSFVDQNQTYTSHSSHQVFLREYAKVDVAGDALGAVAVSTGRLLDGNTASGSFNGAIANWGEVKAQALDMLGISLQDSDVVNVPLLKTDQYGNFIPGPNGYAQLVMAPDGTHATTWFQEGTAAGVTTEGAVKTGHAFLDDIAHAANPVNSQTGAFKTADGNTTVGLSSPIALSNDSFEADSMASGSPGVIDNATLGNYAFIDPQGWDITGPDNSGGVFAPTAAAIGSTGHSGGNVVFLDNAATLVRNTGISLAEGSAYQMTFNVGDRLDTSFGGGTARLVTTDGIVLGTVALPTPADGQWAPVTLSTGAVSAANAGKELRIEFIHGGSGQVLIDNVQLGSIAANTFDNELLDKHFITGDGRGNENIGLTAVHTIFHSEHNRLVDANKATILSSGDRAFINEWLLVDLGANDPIPTDPAGLVWDGERLFQAARFVTEMQYQHLVFEEFARRVQPNVDPFIFTNTADVDPSIVAEFAHVVYRFGHSMLTGTVDRLENDLTTVNGDAEQMTLIEAFLNPQGFINSGANLQEATANLIRGMTRDVGNEMDEFIVSDVRSNLLGLPLDLGALNIARGRDTGVPSLNETRKQLYEDFGLADLKPYTSWVDFAQHLKHPASIVNFIAAYGTHAELLAPDVNTLAEKRAVAMALVTGTSAIINAGGVGGAERIFAPSAADRLDFLNGRGAYAGTVSATNPNDFGGLGGLNDVDLWIGGLAEELNEFGGMLGSTFNFIFEYQMEHLQNGDRLYYLSRTQGLNLLNQLEPNSITDLVMRNTDLGHANSTHLNGALFTTPDYIFELDANIAQEDYNSADPLSKDPIHDDPFLQAIDPRVYRVAPGADVDGDGPADGGVLKYSGGEHVVLGGTEGNDKLIGDKGIDTLWGDGGNDYLNAGMESDDVFGGEGDDIIEDPFGDDVLRGNQGNDVISAGTGLDLIFGDQGKDFLIVGQDDKQAFGGGGDDFILGGTGKDFLLGGEGDDWIEGGEGFDTIAGENSELFFNSPIIGHDVLWGQGNDQDYDSESGDDIMLSGPGIQRFEGMFGFDWGIAKFDPLGANYDFQIPIFTTIPADILRDRFDQVEAASGWKLDDILRGDDRGHSGGSSSPDSTPVELFVDHTLDAAGVLRIKGLNELLGGTALAPITSFKNGNILLGGDGNDLIQGRGGFDVIDGDAWLNVRIGITETKTGGAVVGTAESLTSQVFAVDATGNATTTVLHGGRTLNALMLDATLNPGQMQIIREIKYDDTNVNTATKNIDTAIFQGGDLEYEIEGTRIIYDAATGEALRRVNSTGPESAPLNIRDANGDGFITVRDLDDGTVAAPGRVGGLTVSRGALTDDTDRLVNIERLQFADKTLTVGENAPNRLATGTVTISDPTPFDHDGNPATPGVVSPIVGQVLTATLSNLIDLDGVPLDANGNPVGLTFEWQTTEAGNDGGWATISSGLTYTVRPVDPAHVLRAVAVFKDSQGVTERIASGPTDNVTAPFSVNENTATGTVIAPIPFSLDYDPLGFGGTGVTDGDVVQLTHVISPGQDAGGRFTIVNTGTATAPVYQLAVANGVLLNYEAPVHTPANQSHQFVDNQYQIVIDTYTDTIAAGGVLMAQRQFTIFINDVTGEIADIAPTLDLNGNGILTTTTNLSENFDSTSYTDNDGAWTQDWIEFDDDGSSTSDNGQIRIDNNNNNDNELEFDNGNSAANSNGAMITRVVDLSGASSATLSFDYDEAGFDTGDNETVLVQFAANGTSFTTVYTINGNSGTGNITVPLTGTLSASSAIRFVVSAVNGNTDIVSIDNIVVAKNTTTPVTGTPGTGHVATFSENGAAVAIASFPAVADADNPTLTGATVTLTNARPGDVLSIQGTLPSGITASFGPAVAGKITMYLGGNGPVSYAALQTAIAAVRFFNSGDNPNPVAGASPRVIEVTVSDGEKESVVATATVNVTAVEDPTNANNDTIITNNALGTAFVVPEWVLLANDSDPDNTLDITNVTENSSNFTAVLGGAGVTVTDSDDSGNSFTYTAIGSNSDTASVGVDTVASVNTTTYSETFGGGGTAYTDNDGAWTENWTEVGDNGGSGGNITITGGVLNFNDGVATGQSISRAINLTGATSATLRFDWNETGADVGENILVQAFNGTTWDTLGTLAASAGNASGNPTFNLSAAQIGTHSAIRFESSGGLTAGETFNIDNISIAFTAPATVSGGGGGEILIGDVNGSTFDAGGGNDIVFAGDGIDTIIQTSSTGGRDFVDGGAGVDTYQLNGAAGAETFKIYTRAEALAQIAGLVLNTDTEIVVTRQAGSNVVAPAVVADVIAELDNIEEIIVNTLNTTANNGNNPTTPDGSGSNNGDTIQVIGNFNAPFTSLNFNTITIDGNAGDDTVDISALSSAHRIVFKSNGGNDTIVGTLRSQDVIELPEGATPADYAVTTGADGVTTMTSATHSIHFTSDGGLPQFGNSDDGDDDEEDQDDEQDEGDGGDAGPDDDEDEQDDDAPAPHVPGTPYAGTAAGDVFVATSGDDLILGVGGEDYLIARAGADVVRAGAGDDYVSGGAGADMIFGADGDDDLFGEEGDDMLYGEAGDDLILGGAGADLITAGAGNDSVIGGAGNDLFVAGIGDGSDSYYGDAMNGGLGTDTLDMAAITASINVNLGANNGHGSASSAQSGTDTLYTIENIVTGAGADTITASNAVNVMDGGAGNDTFVFTSATAADGDTILGFEAGDKLDLSGIDARDATGADDSFTLVPGGPGGAAGSLALTYETRDAGEFTVLEGHVNGTGEPAFRLSIAGHLTSADITL